jgi:hypothetical protein
VKIFYVVELGHGDSSRIPISMFDAPAIWTTESRAHTFADFARGTGRAYEVRSMDLVPTDVWERMKEQTPAGPGAGEHTKP